MAKQKENYPKWTLGALVETFGLTSIVLDRQDYPLLSTWLAATTELDAFEEKEVEELRLALVEDVENWDEEDLKMSFISFILRLSKYLVKRTHYRAFFEKTITATLADYVLTTKPDMMLAKRVEDELRTPYFCFHEYKKSLPDKDPRAQLIQDMLIAQTLNGSSKPIYGCYVIGRHWYFVVLNQREYAISHAYDATEKIHLRKIIAILRYFWVILETDLVI